MNVEVTAELGCIARRAKRTSAFLSGIPKVLAKHTQARGAALYLWDDAAISMEPGVGLTDLEAGCEFVLTSHTGLKKGQELPLEVFLKKSHEITSGLALKIMQVALDSSGKGLDGLDLRLLPIEHGDTIRGVLLLIDPAASVTPEEWKELEGSLSEASRMLDVVVDWHIHQELTCLNQHCISLQLLGAQDYMSQLLQEVRERLSCEGMSYFTRERIPGLTSFVLTGTTPKKMPMRRIAYRPGDANIASLAIRAKKPLILHYLAVERNDIAGVSPARWRDVPSKAQTHSVIFIPLIKQRRVEALLRCTNRLRQEGGLFNAVDLYRIRTVAEWLTTWQTACEREKQFSSALLDISHEIRQSIFGIQSSAKYVEIMLSKRRKEGHVENLHKLQHIRESVMGLVSLLPALGGQSRASRLIARVQEEDRPASFRPYADLCMPVCETFRSDLQAKHLNLLFGGEHQLGRLHADINDFRQVFTNLIGNAIKYTDDGNEIYVKLTRAPLASDFASIQVGSKSLPILPEEEEFIFKPGYRSEAVLSTDIPGEGRGLLIARSIARRYGGDLELRRNRGFNIFTLLIPRQLFLGTSRGKESE